MTENSALGGARIEHHAILGDLEAAGAVTIFFEGRPLEAREGEPIMSPHRRRVKVFRYTKRALPAGCSAGSGAAPTA